LQEIFVILYTGNFCHLVYWKFLSSCILEIFVILYTGNFCHLVYWKFLSSCILEIFVILYTLYLLFKKSKSIRQAEDVPILKSTYAGRFIFDLNRKFLFLDFAARKRNIFSTSGYNSASVT
jgi:hypothetical protein